MLKRKCPLRDLNMDIHWQLSSEGNPLNSAGERNFEALKHCREFVSQELADLNSGFGHIKILDECWNLHSYSSCSLIHRFVRTSQETHYIFANEHNRLMLPIGLWRWYINLIIIILVNIHNPILFRTWHFRNWILSPSSGGTKPLGPIISPKHFYYICIASRKVQNNISVIFI
jgi:hypothetical protein